jgi:hypothetical protein
MPKKTPVIVSYHKIGFTISQDCWDGNIHLSKDQPPSAYVFDLSEFAVAGKLANNKITTLSIEERKNVIERGWIYKYTPRPIIYWPKDQVKIDDLKEKSMKELVLMAKSLSPQLIRDYMLKKKKNAEDEEKQNFLTKDDYITLLMKKNSDLKFYPLCNENRLTASNFDEWVYYLDYTCWIDKMADKCSCMECHPIPYRTVNSFEGDKIDLSKNDDYSLSQLQNRHCFMCLCEKCNCRNNSKFGKFETKPFMAGKDSPCLGTCYICRNAVSI